jgi:hypothetical protein
VPTKVTIEEAVRESLDKDPRLRHPSEVAVSELPVPGDAAHDDVAEPFGVIGMTNEIRVVNL